MISYVGLLLESVSLSIHCKLQLLTPRSAKFQYTFFDAFGQGDTVPDTPITPFPTLFTAPVYHANKQTLDLTVANFFCQNPKDGSPCPLDVYLGSIGPLRLRAYQSSMTGPLTAVSPFIRIVHNIPDREEYQRFGGLPPVNMEDAALAPKTGPVHTIVVVDLPPIQDIVRALEDDATLPTGPPTNGERRSSPTNGEAASRPDLRTISGRNLPLLFIRSFDGVGYHSGRAIVVDNMFVAPDMAGIGGIDQMTAPPTFFGGNNLNGWALRVV